MVEPEIRLTALAHGGGCGCKLSPSVLRALLLAVPLPVAPDLLVGTETGDDAAVLRVRDDLAVVATTDFFLPIVDDPYDFGRIAAANALSDVWAMGGTPVLALALLGMPLGRIAPETIGRVLQGGADLCRGAGVPVAGGHSIDNPEPLYGLAVVGLVHPDRILRNSGARVGDALILTKPLGVGVLSAALKQAGERAGAWLETLVGSAITLNDIGAALPGMSGVHAVTDVTGFGLLGHVLEMCRGSGCGAGIDAGAVPLLPGVAALAQEGVATGAARRNWESDAGSVVLAEPVPDWRRALLCDPQTSGGLLIAVAAADVAAVLARVRAHGHAAAAVIGRMRDGPPMVTLA